MKNIIFAFALSFAFVATAQAADPIPAPIFGICQFFNDNKVSLNQGTIVHLESNQKINCHQITEGTTVKFKVVMDVMAEGKVVIRTGSLAIGKIKQVTSGTYNGPAEIRIELKYVQAVDGQAVSLNGNELTVYSDEHGRGTSCTVRMGSGITANVTNNIVIKVD